jgi:hypothetical protein
MYCPFIVITADFDFSKTGCAFKFFQNILACFCGPNSAYCVVFLKKNSPLLL